MRDDFSQAIKQALANRVANICSNQNCRHVTSGPKKHQTGAINIGVAAHISAASPGGPRFDPRMTPSQRKAPGNGIWLCQSCAHMVDSDPVRYGTDTLQIWKLRAETNAARELEVRGNHGIKPDQKFINLENLMPDLIREMRTDLINSPLSREFITQKKSQCYNTERDILVYYIDDHPDLESKLRVLQNNGLIQNITYNNTTRYIITEELASYLTNGW